MSHSLILVDALSSAYWKKKKKKGEWLRAFFPPEQICPVSCVMSGFFWLLGIIKGCFKGQSLNFM
jgi:hypothetical protein